MKPISRNTAAVSLALLLVLSLSPGIAASQGTATNPNGGSVVNVRAWPSYEASILLSIPVGTAVQITGASGDWYAVWVSGFAGYIHSHFIRTEGQQASATVRSGPLNLREAPSMRARVITQLATGTRLAVLLRESDWTQVLYGTQPGYVATGYLRFDGESTPRPPVTTPDANATVRTTNGGSLNLRQYAGSDAPILGAYANGSRVRVLSTSGGWSRVTAGSRTGYMSSRYLVPDGGSGGAGDAVVSNPGAGQVLNLREEPSAASRSLGQYVNGTYVTLLGTGTEWHRVRVGGITGYMMARYVRITSGATPHRTVTGGAGGYVNLRGGPGYQYGVLRQVRNGAAASVTIPYPTWSEVLVRDGAGYLRGYMLSSFLK